MNEYVKSPLQSPHDDLGFYRVALDTVLHELAGLAEARVAVGILTRWGDALDWPAWLLAGTSTECRPPLPIKNRLADDLTITANLLDRFGPAPLLASMLSDIETMFDRRWLELMSAAPDFQSLLHFVIKAANVQNPHARASVTEEAGHFRVTIDALPALGPIGAFVEQAWAVAMMRSLSLFSPRLLRVELGPRSWPTLLLRDADAAALAAIRAFDCIHVEATEGSTTFLTPARAAIVGNARHDPEIWAIGQTRLRKNWIDDPSMMSIGSLRLHIRQTLEATQRAPDLDELAKHLAMSKRTISRKLTALDISFQTIVREEKMRIARRLLDDRAAPVAMVARKLGFGTAASFGRAFRKEHGVSPAEWRDRDEPVGDLAK